MNRLLKCETCGRQDDALLCTLACTRHNDWIIECSKCDTGQCYTIELAKFIEDPIDWLAQLAEKTWFIGEPEHEIAGSSKAFIATFSRMRDQNFVGLASLGHRKGSNP